MNLLYSEPHLGTEFHYTQTVFSSAFLVHENFSRVTVFKINYPMVSENKFHPLHNIFLTTTAQQIININTEEKYFFHYSYYYNIIC
jgi:hypothetical protein